ncbi:MAG: anhydro-N-acetylmuramic acid kinase [Lentimicrobium sp.]|nr:anhydro-N-acetylmuramic acid kinase [Lentimicrobium sp.]
MPYKINEKIQAIGIMSGTSLDGLDIAQCTFDFNDGQIFWEIDHAETIKYPAEITEMLIKASHSDALGYFRSHTVYGNWIGKACRDFIERNNSRPLLIASHGHTIFHCPDEGFTTQIGSGAHIAAQSGIRTIVDFRSLDVALGGQGAPLVPIGDRLLFGNYDACLNIGGFSNISLEIDHQRKAWDICPANFVLNHYAQKLGIDFDKSGQIAASGKTITPLLEKLTKLEYYNLLPPKSLGREWVEENIFPLCDKYSGEITSVLNTLTIHIAEIIGRTLPDASNANVLFTGGGVHNDFLMSKIKDFSNCLIIIPDQKIIDYKEALIFALLGVLRYKGIPNCLSEVTGARANNCGGAIYEI